MATIDYRAPDETKQAFNPVFSRRNKSAIITELILIKFFRVLELVKRIEGGDPSTALFLLNIIARCRCNFGRQFNADTG
jgi:hypothetical protein